MRRLVVILGIVVMGLGLAARAQKRELAASGPRVTAPPPEVTDAIRYHDRRYRSVLDAPLNEMQGALHSLYRLRPDRRFLLAFASVHSILTGDSLSVVDVDHRDGRWEIRYGDEVAGVLPDMPDYGDAMTALVDWASRTGLPSTGGGTVAEGTPDLSDAGSISDLAEALDELQAEWRQSPEPEVLGAAAQLLMRLSLQAHDPLELNDRLHARVLATLAVQAAMSGTADRSTEALLAWRMGYAGFASTAARALPAGDPAGLLIRNDLSGLRDAAERSNAQPFTRRLYLEALATTERYAEWSAWVDRYEPRSARDLGVIASAFALPDFHSDEVLSAAVPYIVADDVRRALRPARALLDWRPLSAPEYVEWLAITRVLGDPADLLVEFEELLASLPVRRDGSFIDQRLHADLYRSIMYGAFFVRSQFALDRLASLPASERLVASLAKAPPGPGIELYRLHQTLTASMSGQPSTSALVAAVAARRVGGDGLVMAFRELVAKSAYGSTDLATGARHLAQRLDSRPDHLAQFAYLAVTRLNDLRVAETTHERLYRIAGNAYPFRAAWYLVHTGELDAARALANDATISLANRSALLGTLESQLGSAEVERLHRAFVAADPTDWALSKELASFLEDADRFADALVVVEHWLAASGAESGFDWISARTASARLLESQGRLSEARLEIADVVPTGQAGAMSRGISILTALGEYEDARSLAADLVGRYPDLDRAYADKARIDWISGNPSEAAATVLAAERRFPLMAMRTAIGGALADAFEDRPVEALNDAIRELREAGISPWALRELGSALAAREMRRDAFAILGDLQTGHPLADIEARVLAWKSLRLIDGNSAADAWLETRIPLQLRDPASMLFYMNREHELLWSMIPHPMPNRASYVWLLRAAASALDGPDDGHRQALLDYYAKGNPDDYDIMGRYVLGLAGEEDMAAVATSPERKCEVAYYLAVRALSEGRRTDASDWLRIVVETGLDNEGEYAWSLELLLRLIQGKV